MKARDQVPPLRQLAGPKLRAVPLAAGLACACMSDSDDGVFLACERLRYELLLKQAMTERLVYLQSTCPSQRAKSKSSYPTTS